MNTNAGPPQDAPSASGERIDALDLVRGVALLGILVMNIRAFAMITAAYSNLMLWGESSLASRLIYHATSALADQKFMTLFSVLFGAGILLMTERTERRGGNATPRHLRRMVWLLLFGLMHAYLIWWGDILAAYAVAGSVAVFARRWSLQRQWLVAGALLLVPALMLAGLYFEYPNFTPEDAAEIAALVSPSAESIARETAAYRGGYLENIRFRVPGTIEIQSHILMLYIWRIIGLMIVGMALLRTDILTGRRSPSFYLKLAAIGLVTGVALSAYGSRSLLQSDFDVRYSISLGMLWNYFGSLFGAAGWLGLILYLRARDFWPGLRTRLAAVGRMAFTHYIFHSVICTTLFYGFGFGLFGELSPTTQLGVVGVIWAVQLIASPWWLARYQFGPLEWVWRALTYGERPPMRR